MTPIPASHADHDLVGIAAHAAGDATGAELDTALAQVAACPECATLHHDLRAIALALPALPAPARRRDFQLTPAQAASLRPSAWRRLLAPLAGPRFAFAGPLGTGLATLGIAGFLVAGAAGLPVAGTASAPAVNPESAADGGTYPNALSAPSGSEGRAAGAASMAAAAPPVDQQVRVSEASGAPVPRTSVDPATGSVTMESGPAASMPQGAAAPAVPTVPVSDVAVVTGSVSWLLLVSGLALAAGLVLVALRLSGRRLAAS